MNTSTSLRPIVSLATLLVSIGLVSCHSTRRPATATSPAPGNQAPREERGDWVTIQTGTASWYGGYWHRRLTANGERFDQNSLTAAHRALPFNTKVRVTNLRNGKSCIIRINNRGPYVKNRIIDLSVAAAKAIGSHAGGLTQVRLEVPKGTRAASMLAAQLAPPLRRPKR